MVVSTIEIYCAAISVVELYCADISAVQLYCAVLSVVELYCAALGALFAKRMRGGKFKSRNLFFKRVIIVCINSFHNSSFNFALF